MEKIAHIHTSASLKDACRDAAILSGLSLSEWVRSVLSHAATGAILPPGFRGAEDTDLTGYALTRSAVIEFRVTETEWTVYQIAATKSLLDFSTWGSIVLGVYSGCSALCDQLSRVASLSSYRDSRGLSQSGDSPTGRGFW